MRNHVLLTRGYLTSAPISGASKKSDKPTRALYVVYTLFLRRSQHTKVIQNISFAYPIDVYGAVDLCFSTKRGHKPDTL